MTQEALKLALEALESAVRYHGVMLMSDPPQDAWKYHRVENKVDKAIAAIKEALAQTQEPVAWLSTDSIGERYLCFDKPLDNDLVQPLYTTPPQRTWVGLTDEEIWSDGDSFVTSEVGIKQFARAIEAKLKEKNT